jgi:hypothetical protein
LLGALAALGALGALAALGALGALAGESPWLPGPLFAAARLRSKTSGAT